MGLSYIPGKELWGRILAFAQASGAGLGLDFCLFLVLTELGWRVGWANVVSAFTAVTFVYFSSARRIFSYRGQFLLPLFGLYLAYQIAAVALASRVIDALAGFGMAPLLAKLVILPVTFSANYAFMAQITKACGAKP